MSTIELALPVEVPGEDIANPPFAPVPAGLVVEVRAAHSSAEFGGPLKHDGWPDAMPTWEDLTPADHDEHRSTCPDTCVLCEGHRQWGLCSDCGHGHAETNDAGLSACCGARVLFGAEADRAWDQ